MDGPGNWKARLADWWAQFPLEDTLRLGFSVLLVLGFVGGLGYLVWIGLNPAETDAECLEDFFLNDPVVPAAFLAARLSELDLVDSETAVASGWGWRYRSGEVRIVLSLDGMLYSAIPCFSRHGGFSVLDIVAEGPDESQP